MRQARLNDAAIALGRVFAQNGIQFGIFGGCAIAINGGPRESKDIDVIAVRQDKSTLNRLLDGFEGFKAMPISRNDVAIFIWNDRDDSQWATVEIFTGVSHMRQPNAIEIHGETQGRGTTYILDEVYLFKGKLRAAATRAKYSDAADIIWLENKYWVSLKADIAQYNILWCGLALKRYPHLIYAFTRIGINISTATEAAKDIPLESFGGGAKPGEVQSGIIG